MRGVAGYRVGEEAGDSKLEGIVRWMAVLRIAEHRSDGRSDGLSDNCLFGLAVFASLKMRIQ